jgi:hypothetical protein
MFNLDMIHTSIATASSRVSSRSDAVMEVSSFQEMRYSEKLSKTVDR